MIHHKKMKTIWNIITSQNDESNDNKSDINKPALNNDAAVSILNECKHICYIASIENNKINGNEYLYQLWIKGWNTDPEGQILKVNYKKPN